MKLVNNIWNIYTSELEKSGSNRNKPQQTSTKVKYYNSQCSHANELITHVLTINLDLC